MNKWFIGIKPRGEDLYDLNDLTILESPNGHYWADPFVVEDGNNTFVFFEDYDYEKGRIAVGTLSGKKLVDVRVILDEPKHMSFPSVQQIDGEWYMVPERCLAGTLSLYWSPKKFFPYLWQMISVIEHGRYDDPILKKTEDGIQVWATQSNVLHVFQTPKIDIACPWREVSYKDAPFMRNAGNFIGDIRPTQDSAPVYGRAIKFLRGDNVIHTIEPDWYPELTGTHTFNVSEKFVVIDGRIKIS